MQIENGDLWDFHAKGDRVVVTTNIGWAKSGKFLLNNMGAGMALQASQRFPELPAWYGAQCAYHADRTPVLEFFPLRDRSRLLLVPVKTLDPSNPAMSWAQKASGSLIRKSLKQLVVFARDGGPRIAMSFPGCGNGGLEEARVLKIIRDELEPEIDDGLVVLVRYAAAERRRRA